MTPQEYKKYLAGPWKERHERESWQILFKQIGPKRLKILKEELKKLTEA